MDKIITYEDKNALISITSEMRKQIDIMNEEVHNIRVLKEDPKVKAGLFRELTASEKLAKLQNMFNDILAKYN